MSVSLSIKNVPDDLAKALRSRAERHHRSLQGELLAIIEESVRPATLSVDELYERGKRRRLPRRPKSADIVRQMRDAR